VHSIALAVVSEWCQVVSILRCSPAASAGSGQPKLRSLTAASPRKKVVRHPPDGGRPVIIGNALVCPSTRGGFSN
jgi:hypothetical protein